MDADGILGNGGGYQVKRNGVTSGKFQRKNRWFGQGIMDYIWDDGMMEDEHPESVLSPMWTGQ